MKCFRLWCSKWMGQTHKKTKAFAQKQFLLDCKEGITKHIKKILLKRQKKKDRMRKIKKD